MVVPAGPMARPKCNGVIVFDDMGEILPNGRVVPAHHPARVRLPLAA